MITIRWRYEWRYLSTDLICNPTHWGAYLSTGRGAGVGGRGEQLVDIEIGNVHDETAIGRRRTVDRNGAERGVWAPELRVRADAWSKLGRKIQSA